jgi:hypothetical protein
MGGRTYVSHPGSPSRKPELGPKSVFFGIISSRSHLGGNAIMAFSNRRKAREHLSTSTKGNIFPRNKGVRYDDENKTVDTERGRQTAVGLGQLNSSDTSHIDEPNKEFTFDVDQFRKELQELHEDHLKNYKPTRKDLTPNPEKYGRELQELYRAERQLHAKHFRGLNDEELFASYNENQGKYLEGKISNAHHDALEKAIESRLMEPRFQSPIPMPSVYAVVGPAPAGPALAAYQFISERFSDEDLGLSDYNPPLLDEETQDSIAWKIRKERGHEAHRRHAIIKALHDQRQELNKGHYEFTPNPEPEPKTAAAPAEPPQPPGNSNPPDDWKYPKKNFGLPEGGLAEYYYENIPKNPKE